MAATVGSHALLLQLATIVHNVPEQGTVRVTTRVRGENVELAVENTGEQRAPHLVDGTLTLAPRVAGGLRVTVRVPATTGVRGQLGVVLSRGPRVPSSAASIHDVGGTGDGPSSRER